jgi:insulysin
MAQILKEPCFNTLRIQEQLGCVVGSALMVMNTVQGFRIRIQSEKNCAFLEKGISNFLVNFEKELEAMSEGEFEKHKISLINKQLEKPKNLSEESETLWDHIGSGTFDFDRVDSLDIGRESISFENDIEHILASDLGEASKAGEPGLEP